MERKVERKIARGTEIRFDGCHRAIVPVVPACAARRAAVPGR